MIKWMRIIFGWPLTNLRLSIGEIPISHLRVISKMANNIPTRRGSSSALTSFDPTFNIRISYNTRPTNLGGCTRNFLLWTSNRTQPRPIVYVLRNEKFAHWGPGEGEVRINVRLVFDFKYRRINYPLPVLPMCLSWRIFRYVGNTAHKIGEYAFLVRSRRVSPPLN